MRIKLQRYQMAGGLVFAIFSLFACDQQGKNISKPILKRTDIVSGYGEQTFTDRFNLKLTLPMPEQGFISLLRNLKLHYETCGERGTGAGIPQPRRDTTVDFSNAQRCYEIIGSTNREVGEAWRAFVDEKQQVFYIESGYAHSNP